MEQAFTYITNNLCLKRLDLNLKIKLAEDCCDESWARSIVQIKGLDCLRCPVESPSRWKLFSEGIAVEEDDPTRQRRISKMLGFLIDKMLTRPPDSRNCSFQPESHSDELHNCNGPAEKHMPRTLQGGS